MLDSIVGVLLEVIHTSAILIILGAFVYAVTMFLVTLVKKGYNTKVGIEGILLIRRHLGTYLLFALEIMIAADLIQTVVHPGYQALIELAGIVAIRIVVSYFLEKEIKELKTK